MGLPMARLLSRQFAVTAHDQRAGIEEPGLTVVDSLPELVSRLPDRRIIWLMIPAAGVGEVLQQLLPLLADGDVVIDGGNSEFGDSVLHGRQLADHGIHYVGVGCSGGVKGAADGPPMTVGCSGAALDLVRPLLDALGGHYTCYDSPGFGHLAKGIHNAIEYGMMQSTATSRPSSPHWPATFSSAVARCSRGGRACAWPCRGEGRSVVSSVRCRPLWWKAVHCCRPLPSTCFSVTRESTARGAS